MAVKLVDLDQVIPEDRAVTINGHKHPIPGSPPMEWYLWHAQFLERITADGYALTRDDIKTAQAKVLELLRERTPALKAVAGLTPSHVMGFILNAYGAADNERDGDDGPPPRATRGGTPRTRARSTRRS